MRKIFCFSCNRNRNKTKRIIFYCHKLTPRLTTKTKKDVDQARIFSFSNKLNDIIPILCDKWFDGNEANTKMILKAKLLDTFSATCDLF